MTDELSNEDIQNELNRLSEKLTIITSNLDAQQKSFEEEFTTLTSLVEAMSIIRYYAARNDPMTCKDLNDGVISCLQRLEEIRCSTTQQDLQEYIEEREKHIFGTILDLAKRKNLSSGELFSTLHENLDDKGIIATVNLDDVIRVYGTSEAKNWKALLLQEY